jgi:hypothetical protein
VILTPSYSQGLEEPTDEQIFQAHREESARISATLLAIPRTQSTSTINSWSNLDFSGLVELRAAHETLQARNGVRNSSRESTSTNLSPSPEGSPEAGDRSDFKRARQQIVKQFYQLLRDANTEGERVGTGLHRNHVWVGLSGNSLNAEKAAEGRTKTVCGLFHPVNAKYYAHCLKGNREAASRVYWYQYYETGKRDPGTSGCGYQQAIPVGLQWYRRRQRVEGNIVGLCVHKGKDCARKMYAG